MTDPDGKKFTGQIYLTFTPKSKQFLPLMGVAQRDSIKIAYTKPTSVQRADTYISFGRKSSDSSNALGAVYITGNSAKQIDTDSGKTTSLFLNDADLATAIDNCNTTKGSSGNFAAITKTSGNYPAEPTPDTGGLLKQFDTFYISSSYPNGIPCEDDSKEDAVVAQMKTLQKALVEAFKTAEKY